MKVKREALQVLGTFHAHIGPAFKAVSNSLAKPALRDELERCFEKNKYDPTLQKQEWSKRSLFDSRYSQPGKGVLSGSAIALEVPRSDLMADLPDDCVQRLVSIPHSPKRYFVHEFVRGQIF